MALIKHLKTHTEQRKQDSSEPKLIISKDKVQEETSHAQILEAEEDFHIILQKDLN